MDFNELMVEIKNYAKFIDDYIELNIKGDVEPLWSAARHYITKGGKRMRPFMVLKVAELISERKIHPTDGDLISIASAVEILHNFTLVHDDIMDKDEFRRGIPTVHTKWGENTAILAGDLLFALVFLIVSKASIKDSNKNAINEELALVSKLLCEGQIMDIRFETQEAVSEQEYIQMISLKTAALFKTCVKIGAIYAQATENQKRALEHYATNLGIAFQLIDDILGLIGSEKELGKPVGSDIRQSKKTILYVKALEFLSPKIKSQLKAIFAKNEKTTEEIQTATQIIIESGALDYAKKRSEEYIKKSIEALSEFPESQTKDLLISIANFTLERKF